MVWYILVGIAGFLTIGGMDIFGSPEAEIRVRAQAVANPRLVYAAYAVFFLAPATASFVGTRMRPSSWLAIAALSSGLVLALFINAWLESDKAAFAIGGLLVPVLAALGGARLGRRRAV